MPLKSKAQIRKWGELVKEGKISYDEKTTEITLK